MLKMHSGAAATAAALFVCALCAGPVREALAAAQFSVSPLKLSLAADKLATSLTLGNSGKEPVTVQAELVAWTQENGEDRYAPAAGMVVSPPIFKLDAGGRQVVRIGRLKKGPAPAREQSYRIRLSEVPSQASDKFESVSTFMQLTLPVFVPPADRAAKSALDVKASLQPNGDLRLAVSNAGAVHDKITRLTLAHDGKAIAERGFNYYVLAGASRELTWPGALKEPPGPVELKIHLDGRNRFLTQVLGAAPAPAPAPEAQPAN